MQLGVVADPVGLRRGAWWQGACHVEERSIWGPWGGWSSDVGGVSGWVVSAGGWCQWVGDVSGWEVSLGGLLYIGTFISMIYT